MSYLSSVYGFIEVDLEQARSAVERALGIRLDFHESLYRGGAYYCFTKGDEAEVILQKNYDRLDGGPAEIEFPNMALLLYVEGTQRAEEFASLLEKNMEGVVLLRRVDD